MHTFLYLYSLLSCQIALCCNNITIKHIAVIIQQSCRMLCYESTILRMLLYTANVQYIIVPTRILNVCGALEVLIDSVMIWNHKFIKPLNTTEMLLETISTIKNHGKQLSRWRVHV